MKMFAVRLHNYNGAVVDGEVFEAINANEALKMYKARCYRLGVEKCEYDTYSVEEIEW